MRVLVTGAGGFIGGCIVTQLCDAGHDVVALDSFEPTAHNGVPDDLDGRAAWHRVDLRDAGRVDAIVEGVEAVSHQASRVGLGVDFDDVVDYVSHNDLATAVLLRALHRTGFGGRFVLASSMVVYGEGAYRCAEHGSVRPAPRRAADLDAGRFEPRCPACGREIAWDPIDEDAPLDPRNVYAATKLGQEHLCRIFGREHELAVTALRYHNVYGPRMPRDTPYAGVASIFRSQLAAGLVPKVFEDGGQYRDFVHVDDVARANVAAVGAARPYDGALNVASGHPYQLLAMARAIAAPYGREPEVVGGYRLGDVRHVVASPRRAQTAIGFTAKVDPDSGFRDFAVAPLRSA